MLNFHKLNGQIIINGTEGEELIPNTVDAAFEKHVPVIEHNSDSVTVRVGSVAHPMLEAHYITFIVLETASGGLSEERA